MRSRACPLFRPQGGGELCQPRNRTWRAVPHQVAFCNVMGSYLRIKPTRIGAAIKGIRTAGPPWHADRRFVGEIKYSFVSGTEGLIDLKLLKVIMPTTLLHGSFVLAARRRGLDGMVVSLGVV